jgi:hypothetical protein
MKPSFGLRGEMKAHKNLQKGVYLSQTNLVYHIFSMDTRGNIDFSLRLAFFLLV